MYRSFSFVEELRYNVVMLYAIYPGTVTTYDDEVQSFTYEELIELYGVDPEDCVLGSEVPQNQLVRYILLHPRRDGIYDNMPAKADLGDEIKWGPDFDGKKKWTMETDYNALYAEQNAERKP